MLFHPWFYCTLDDVAILKSNEILHLEWPYPTNSLSVLACCIYPCAVLPPVQFIRHRLWHGIPNYDLTIHLFYTIIVMIMNLGLLNSTFDYKSIDIKIVL